MDRYYGFDLGDAESAVSVLNKSDAGVPRVLTVGEARSFVTAYARLQNGSLVIGEAACYNPEAVERKIRFKSRFLRDPESRKDVKSFAAGVLGELYMSGDLVKGEDCCFYVGCPAGWDKTARERYRELFEEAAYPPVRIISESRAALVSACQSKHFQVGYDILSKPVLVVDAGSSTTDFAYIMGGKEVDMQTAGEVALGGGIMDEVLLSCSLHASARGEGIRELFARSPPWKRYGEIAARQLKEKYCADEDYWKNNKCMQSIIISYEKPIRLQLVMDAKTADHILYDGIPQLEGKSFKDVFMKSLQQVRERIQGELPELVFLTGGVSKLPAVREWCREAFPDAVVITGAEPEFSVSRGLAWSGRIDEELRQFRAEIQDLIGSSTVERIVENHIDELYHSTVDMLVTPILENAAMPVFDRWRGGEIERLSDINAEMEKAIENYLHTEEVQEMLVNPITQWLKPVSYELEEMTMPICIRHGVPYRALSLSSFLSISDLDIKVDAKDVFAVEEITWLIDTIISILIGLLCGGSGVALISGGIAGVVAGAMISLMVLALGKEKMEEVMMNMVIPRPIRKLIPRGYFMSRIEKVSDEVRSTFYETLEKDKNVEITKRLVDEISEQIEQCLTKMAEVVEIPLG